MTVNEIINPRDHVSGIKHINDTATCPVTGNVYISGVFDDFITVIVFSHLREFIRSINTRIRSNGDYSFISVSRAGDLVITCDASTVITIMDQDGTEITRVDTGRECRRCVSDSQDRLYVGHYSGLVSVWSRDGTRVREIGVGDGLSRPEFLYMHQDTLYVSDYGNHAVYIYQTDCDVTTPRVLTSGPVHSPQGVCVDGDGHVVVVCTWWGGGDCVSVFSQDGRLLHQILDYRLLMPRGLSLTHHGELLVTEFVGDIIVVCR
jgi:sugar lactone lactonase YvrE